MNYFKSIPAAFKIYRCMNIFLKNAPEIEKAWKEKDHEQALKIINDGENTFCDNIEKKLSLSLDIIGNENIPESTSGPFLIVANHQGYADIFAILDAFRNRPISFIAKSEFKKFKPLAKSIYYTGSLFIKRGSPRDAVYTLKDATERFHNGYTLAIFPEGTRSHSTEMNHFKPGSFKFAIKAGVPILPITLLNTYKIFEENNSFESLPIKMVIHPLFHIEKMNRSDQKNAHLQIEKIIRDGLEKYKIEN